MPRPTRGGNAGELGEAASLEAASLEAASLEAIPLEAARLWLGSESEPEFRSWNHLQPGATLVEIEIHFQLDRSVRLRCDPPISDKCQFAVMLPGIASPSWRRPDCQKPPACDAMLLSP